MEKHHYYLNITLDYNNSPFSKINYMSVIKSYS